MNLEDVKIKLKDLITNCKNIKIKLKDLGSGIKAKLKDCVNNKDKLGLVSKLRMYLIVVSVLLLGFTSGIFITRTKTVPAVIEIEEAVSSENIQDNDNEMKEAQNIIGIHIKGEINNPGYYELEENSRVKDAVEKAGGLTDDADLRYVNLAEILFDTQQVIVPRIGEMDSNISSDVVRPDYKGSQPEHTRSASVPKSGQIELSKTDKLVSDSDERVNINTADVMQFCRLPGIGESTANKIIATRDSLGYFKSVEEIKSVPGIGDKKFESIKNLLSV